MWKNHKNSEQVGEKREKHCRAKEAVLSSEKLVDADFFVSADRYILPPASAQCQSSDKIILSAHSPIPPNSSSIAHFPAPMGDAKKLPLWYHQDRKESLHAAANRHRR